MQGERDEEVVEPKNSVRLVPPGSVRLNSFERSNPLQTYTLPLIALAVLGAIASSCQRETTQNRTAQGDSLSIDTSDYFGLTAAQLAQQNLICEPVSGATPSYIGSGACAGNVAIAIDLSTIYPGLALHYNSTWHSDRLGFGKNVTISHVSYVWINPSLSYGNWFQAGDGTYVPLVYKSSGPFSGSYIAADRNQTTASFTLSSSGISLVQREMTGETYSYTKLSNGLFALQRSENPLGELMRVTAIDFRVQEIAYPGDEVIQFSRQGGQVIVTNNKRLGRVAELTIDANNRLTKVDIHGPSTVPITHELKYPATGNWRVEAYEVRSPGTSHFMRRYIYDRIGRVIAEMAESGLNLTYTRDSAGRKVIVRDGDGVFNEEKFDENGRIIEHRRFIEMYEWSPLDQASYEYNASSGMLSKIVFPKARLELTYGIAAEPKMLTHSKLFVQDAVISELQLDRNADTWLPTRQTAYGPNRIVEKDVQTAWTPNWPYRPTKVTDHLGRTETRFAYSGANTTVSDYKKGLKTNAQDELALMTEKKFAKLNLTQVTNKLLPANIATATFTYDSRGRINTASHGGKSVTISYTGSGAWNRAARSDGLVIDRVTDESTSRLTSEKVTYPTGAWSKTDYTQVLAADGSLRSAAATTTKGESSSATNETVRRDMEFDGFAGGEKLTKLLVNGKEVKR
jgi:YD repeat-containing protein